MDHAYFSFCPWLQVDTPNRKTHINSRKEMTRELILRSTGPEMIKYTK